MSSKLALKFWLQVFMPKYCIHTPYLFGNNYNDSEFE